MRPVILPSALALALVACSSPPTFLELDAASPDAASPDAASPDAGDPDASTPDAIPAGFGALAGQCGVLTLTELEALHDAEIEELERAAKVQEVTDPC